MSLPQLTRKEATWLQCKDKSCCYTAFVVPTGRDVWRIAQALQSPLWAYAVFFESPQARRDAFMLDRSGRRFRLALAKQPAPADNPAAPPACIFLLRTRNGHHRCGLGELRPLVCRTFPGEMVAGVVHMRSDLGCTCRNWSLADVEISEELALIEARQHDAEEYCEVVGRWNAQVRASAPDAEISFFDFCDFLLAAYDDIAAKAAAEAP